MSRGSGAKNYTFTLHCDEKKGEHFSWPTIKVCPIANWWDRHEETGLVYFLCSVERASTTGKIHLQGFICLSKRTTLPTMKRLFSDKAHWETMRGTIQENYTYCTKEQTHLAGPWDFGDIPTTGKGSRSDLKAIYGMVKEHQSNLAILEATDGKSARFEKQINYIRFVTNEAASDRQTTGVRVIVLYGDTDIGKTFRAVNTFGAGDYHLQECPSHKDQKIWFDGYVNQKKLILDDFSGDFVQFRYLLRLLDKYKLKIEYKGGHSWAVWDTVIITTNIHPSQWYAGVNTAPLKRRIAEIRYCIDRGQYQLMDWDEKTIGDVQQWPPVASPSRVTSPMHLPNDLRGDCLPATPLNSPDVILDTPQRKRQRSAGIPKRIEPPVQKEKEKQKGVQQDCGPDLPKKPEIIAVSDSDMSDPDDDTGDNHDPDKDVRTCSPTQPWPDMGAQPF